MSMKKSDLDTLVIYIVDQAVRAISENTDEKNLPVDYMGIFAKNDAEYDDLERLLRTLGAPGDTTATPSGTTFLLHEPLHTSAGPLKVLKVRKPDPTRPQRGAPDFRVSNYPAFKEKYFLSGKYSNFSLMVRPAYEMIELKGVGVLVYFPSKSFDERQLATS
jgi:hypothetical protein